VDRDAIERRDFPVGRRGYDPAAVDAHLREVADQMDGLRERAEAPRPRGGLAAGASDRVREILEAAERSAGEIREQAGRDASDHVARVGEATAAMMSRLDQLQRELDGLLEGLRSSGAVLEEGLARLQDDVRGMEGDEPAPEPTPAPPEPDAIPEPPVVPADEAPAAEAPDDAGARLIVLNMALGGTPREEAARYLAEHYDLSDPGALLDDVYSRVDPPAA
jgi:DivIVA domain-containing protein